MKLIIDLKYWIMEQDGASVLPDDKLEIEIESLDKIPGIYEQLKALAKVKPVEGVKVAQPKKQATTARKQTTKINLVESPALAFYEKSGKPVTDKNGKQLTRDQYGIAKEIYRLEKRKIWDLEIGKDL